MKLVSGALSSLIAYVFPICLLPEVPRTKHFKEEALQIWRFWAFTDLPLKTMMALYLKTQWNQFSERHIFIYFFAPLNWWSHIMCEQEMEWLFSSTILYNATLFVAPEAIYKNINNKWIKKCEGWTEQCPSLSKCLCNTLKILYFGFDFLIESINNSHIECYPACSWAILVCLFNIYHQPNDMKGTYQNNEWIQSSKKSNRKQAAFLLDTLSSHDKYCLADRWFLIVLRWCPQCLKDFDLQQHLTTSVSSLDVH